MELWKLPEQGKKALEAAEIKDPGTDALILLEYVCGISRAEYLLRKSDEASEEIAERFFKCIEERAAGKPVQYITGQAPFFGLDFLVNEHVLIPRFDTEVLVDTVLKTISYEDGLDILDMCTGSGCIAISLAHEIRRRGYDGLKVTGSDISGAALFVAGINAARNHTDVSFVQSDLFEDIDDTFDVIVSNPPYIRTADIEALDREVKAFEPRQALDGAADGLFFYKWITAGAAKHLKPGGFLFYEIGWDQAGDVERIMTKEGFREINIIKDLAGLDRVIWGRYC